VRRHPRVAVLAECVDRGADRDAVDGDVFGVSCFSLVGDFAHVLKLALIEVVGDRVDFSDELALGAARGFVGLR
jgi:hypothetical protein